MSNRWVWKATLRRKTIAILLHSLQIPLAMVGAYMLGKGELLLCIILVCAAIVAEAAYNWLKPYWEQP